MSRAEYSAKDCAHMARALRLAARGQYTAHPNPMVGCVVAKDDKVVGEGWHMRAGSAHAEISALQAAGDQARGATVYVSLEPCAHHGKTPPCTEALIKAGVRDVIIALEDPFDGGEGRGLKLLADAGIGTSVGLMAAAAAELNAGFLQRINKQRPFVRMKLASSLDGAIAMASGESQWITGPEARADVHRLRARSGAVMTGIGTVLADDPALNVRAKDIDTGGLQPLRVVLDSHMRMPPTAAMLTLPGWTLVCSTGDHDATALGQAGAEVMSFAGIAGRVDVSAVLAELASRGINDVLVEAGPGLAGHLLEEDLVDELVIYQAPHIMGSQTMGMVNTPSWSTLADRKVLKIKDVRRVGADMRITATRPG